MSDPSLTVLALPAAVRAQGARSARGRTIGLAVSLVFGIFVSTLLTLVVIPVLYYALRLRSAPPSATEPPAA